MAKVILISCVKKKLPHKAKARNLYISDLFKSGLRYAESLNPDKIFILSAEYGLIDLDEDIEPYNLTLNEMSVEERKKWARKVIEKLEGFVDLKNDKIIFLAGIKYREFLIPHIINYEIPMKGLGIGKQLKYLKENV